MLFLLRCFHVLKHWESTGCPHVCWGGFPNPTEGPFRSVHGAVVANIEYSKEIVLYYTFSYDMAMEIWEKYQYMYIILMYRLGGGKYI